MFIWKQTCVNKILNFNAVDFERGLVTFCDKYFILFGHVCLCALSQLLFSWGSDVRSKDRRFTVLFIGGFSIILKIKQCLQNLPFRLIFVWPRWFCLHWRANYLVNIWNQNTFICKLKELSKRTVSVCVEYLKQTKEIIMLWV